MEEGILSQQEDKQLIHTERHRLREQNLLEVF